MIQIEPGKYVNPANITYIRDDCNSTGIWTQIGFVGGEFIRVRVGAFEVVKKIRGENNGL
jgi:hypothetical protein